MMLHRTRRIQQALCGLFLADPGRTWYGIDMMRTAGVNAGGLYVVLERMRGNGWLDSHWEDGPYPRRRYYRPTVEGEAGMRAWLLEQNWMRRRGSSPSSSTEGAA